jgi:hypothetical protein
MKKQAPGEKTLSGQTIAEANAGREKDVHAAIRLSSLLRPRRTAASGFA